MRDVPARARLFQFAALALFVVTAAPSRGADGAMPGYDTSRIVSIGGSVTEILYALGAQQKIVAVDTTSLYPPSALQEKPNVGYMRQLSPEGVLGLSPTLVLAIEGSGPKETIDVLGRAKVPFVIVPDKFTGDGIIDKVRSIAADIGSPDRGECLARMVRDDMAALDLIRAKVRQPLKVAFVLSLANERPMLSGRGTAADGIIRMAGANNAFDEFQGYKAVNSEAIVAARPDAVLVMERGQHSLSSDAVFSQPGFAMTPAAEHKMFVSMDGAYLLGFGPRAARAAHDLAMKLYPDVSGDLPSERNSAPLPCSQ